MPYKIFPEGRRFKVYKVTASGRKTGKALGNHSRRADAEKQLTALNINVNELAESAISGWHQTIDAPTDGHQSDVIEGEEIAGEIEEISSYQMRYEPGWWQARSFADFDQVEKAAEMRERLQKRNDQFYELWWRVWNDEEIPFTAKPQAWRSIFAEFMEVFEQEAQIMEEMKVAEGFVDLSETAALSEAAIVSTSDPDSSGSPSGGLYLEAEIIQPGFGNQRDNHYYGADMLQEYADKFKGVKMYVVDHDNTQRSERTEVSEIEDVIGFSDAGAPIAKIAVFDPVFAEKTRTRAKMGKLHTLECSILAEGTARKGKIDGRPAKIVESITRVHAVDWVSRAGAGGRATRLTEAEQLAEKETEVIVKKDPKDKPAADDLEETEAIQITEAETEKGEQKTDDGETPIDGPDKSDEAEENPAENQPDDVKENDVPEYMSESDVSSALDGFTIPVAVRNRISEMKFESATDLENAVHKELAYIESITGAGQPNAGQPNKAAPTPPDLTKIGECQDAILEEWKF